MEAFARGRLSIEHNQQILVAHSTSLSPPDRMCRVTSCKTANPSSIWVNENSGGATPSAKPLPRRFPDRTGGRDPEASSHSGKLAVPGALRTCASVARRRRALRPREWSNPRSALPSRRRRAIAGPVFATASASPPPGDESALMTEDRGRNVAAGRHCVITGEEDRCDL